jgi:hypothetical protein
LRKLAVLRVPVPRPLGQPENHGKEESVLTLITPQRISSHSANL